MPSLATRLAFEQSVGGVDSLAQQIEGLDSDKITQSQGDARYVRQDFGTAWTAPTGTLLRTTFAATSATANAAYVQADTQALLDRVEALEKRLAAAITDLKANGGLT